MKTKLLIFALLVASILALWFFVLRDFLSLTAIQSTGDTLRTQAESHKIIATLLFIAADLLVVVLCLPAVALMMLMAGFIFGTLHGGLAVLAGSGGGAILLFLIARSALGAFLRRRAGGLYAKVAAGMEQDAVSYLLFMRLVPVFPFAFVNILPALFDIPLRTFAWTTLLGITPAIFIYAYLGQTLGSIENLSDLFSPSLALALSLMGLLALAPVGLKRMKIRPKA